MCKRVCKQCADSNIFWECCMNKDSERYNVRRFDIATTEACALFTERPKERQYD